MNDFKLQFENVNPKQWIDLVSDQLFRLQKQDADRIVVTFQAIATLEAGLKGEGGKIKDGSLRQQIAVAKIACVTQMKKLIDSAPSRKARRQLTSRFFTATNLPIFESWGSYFCRRFRT